MGGGSTQAVSLTAFFPVFFFYYFPKLWCVICGCHVWEDNTEAHCCSCCTPQFPLSFAGTLCSVPHHSAPCGHAGAQSRVEIWCCVMQRVAVNSSTLDAVCGRTMQCVAASCHVLQHWPPAGA